MYSQDTVRLLRKFIRRLSQSDTSLELIPTFEYWYLLKIRSHLNSQKADTLTLKSQQTLANQRLLDYKTGRTNSHSMAAQLAHVDCQRGLLYGCLVHILHVACRPYLQHSTYQQSRQANLYV